MEKQEQEVITVTDDLAIFHILEGEDEKQIVAAANEQLKQALVYEIEQYNTKTRQMEAKPQLSYTGIKHICVLMAQRAEKVGALALVEEPKIKLETIKYSANGQEHTIQKWFVDCLVRNTKTGAVVPGVSEASLLTRVKKRDPVTNKPLWNDEKKSYEFEDGYDDFGRTKAVAKAFRNGCRPHIPEQLILELITLARQTGAVQTVKNITASVTEFCSCASTEARPVADKEECQNCGKKLTPTRKDILLKVKQQTP